MRHIDILKQDENNLIDILIGGLAVDRNGKPRSCRGTPCSMCLFFAKSGYSEDSLMCKEYREMWLKDLPMSEITKDEKKFLETIDGNLYIARDADGALRLHEAEPIKSKAFATWSSDKMIISLPCRMFKVGFPFITWENEYPTKVKDLLKMPVSNKEV